MYKRPIKEGGYATSPTYVTNVMAVIDSNNVTQYDNVVTGNAQPQPAESKSAEELAQEIINGTWGNNPERRENITAKYGAAAVSYTHLNAEHISYELTGNPVERFSVSGVNAEQALNKIGRAHV